jgi:Plasmid pRiA4b ORF-3-like protein
MAGLFAGRYAEEAWEAEIEIDELATLDDLHLAIQKAVRFDNHHLYAFYVARDVHSQSKEYTSDLDDGYDETPIKNVFPLPPQESLFYLFDWGDEWIFKIIKSRKAPFEPVKRRGYPRVESTVGVRPKQYVYN